MTVLMQNNFETQLAPGTAITVANSDDGTPPAGDPVASTNQGGAGSSITFDNAHAAHGTLSAKYTQGSTPSYKNLSWTIASTVEFWGRLYIYMDSWPSTNVTMHTFWTGAQQCVWTLQSADGKINVQDSTFANKGTTAFALTTGSWNRLEYHYSASTTVGFVEIELFSYDSLVQTDGTFTSSTGNFGANITGIVPEMNAFAANAVWWIDDILVNNTGFPGPVPTASPDILLPPPMIGLQR